MMTSSPFAKSRVPVNVTVLPGVYCEVLVVRFMSAFWMTPRTSPRFARKRVVTRRKLECLSILGISFS